MISSGDNSTSAYKLALASVYGASRGVIGLIVEHPLDTIKTRLQAKPVHTVKSAISEIFYNFGIRGFYSGFIPNAIRLSGKQLYRWPLMVGLPPFYRNVIPLSMQNDYPTLPKVSTGLSIAIIEVYLICPLERLKVYLMTSKEKDKSISKFLTSTSGNRIQELFRGSNAMFPRQIVSWVTFLGADEKFKTWERKRTALEILSFTSLLKVSAMVGAINTLAVMPFDMIKTNLQKHDFMPSEGLVKTAKRIYRQHGVPGFYAGWHIRMAQYMIQSAFTVTLLDKFELMFKQKKL